MIGEVLVLWRRIPDGITEPRHLRALGTPHPAAARLGPARSRSDWVDGLMGQTEPYKFVPTDREGRDLLRLADKAATSTILESCSELIALPLVQELASNAKSLPPAVVLQRLLECTLSLAFIARQANAKDIEASDAIAAGALIGMVATSPGKPFPAPGKFTVVKGLKDARQNVAAQWYGNAAPSDARGMRVYEHACLNALRHYLHKVIDSGELRRCYVKAFLLPGITATDDKAGPHTAADIAELPQGVDVAADLTESDSANENPEPPLSAKDGKVAGSDEPGPDRRATRGPARHRRTLWAAGIAAGLLLLGFVGYRVFIETEQDRPALDVLIEVNRDKLVVDPVVGDLSRGSYVTNQPIERVPPPPGLRDSCTGRWAWAHSEALQSVDADTTIARVDLTALSRRLAVVGAQVHFDNNLTPSMTGTYLTCPGGGGGEPPHWLDVELNGGKITYYEGDKPATLNLPIDPGTSETLIVFGRTQEQFSRWRLELAISDGSRKHALTIGSSGYAWGSAADHPEVKSFETTGSLASKPYRFIEGGWKLGR